MAGHVARQTCAHPHARTSYGTSRGERLNPVRFQRSGWVPCLTSIIADLRHDRAQRTCSGIRPTARYDAAAGTGNGSLTDGTVAGSTPATGLVRARERGPLPR
jgi:hypothetical protein